MTTTDPLNRDVRLPKALKDELDILLYQVKNEGMDLVIVVDGKEGSGKTRTERVLGAYCAKVLGTTFGVENIHYGTQEYMRSSEKLGRFSVHCLDEAGVILHRASSNTKLARRFTKYLQVAREGNNQVHIITLPAYHILDGYVVNWRCKFVMNMYVEKVSDPNSPTGKRIKRGAFKVYPSNNSITECWNLYQDRKVFIYPKQWFLHDRMPDCEPFTEQELAELYEKKKKWRNEFIEDESKEAKLTAKQENALIQFARSYVREGKSYTRKELRDRTNLSESQVHRLFPLIMGNEAEVSL